ncbi:MAG: hypothetical protein RL411_151 [Bacteroidota bacterium]
MKKNINHISFRIVITFVFAIQLGVASAQDLHFSQFYEAPLLRNPALAGIYEGDVRIQGVYRTQWGSITYPFQTGSINAEYKFLVGKGQDYLTVGGQVLYDKAGSLNLQTVHVLPTVNFHKALSTNRISYLSLGFMGGLVNRRLDRSRVTTDSQYDGFMYDNLLPDNETFRGSYAYTDMSVGMSFNTSFGSDEQHYLFAGAAYHHFNKPSNSFYRDIPHLPKTVLSGGLKLNFDEFTYVTFHGDYSRQMPFQELIAGGLYSKVFGSEGDVNYTVHGGMYYRYNDAFIPVLKMDVNRLSFGLSYDINVSKLARASLNRGGFEISMSWHAIRARADAPVLCPKF